MIIDPATLAWLQSFVKLSALMDVIAALISLLCTYFPRFRVWYGGKSEVFKTTFQLGVLLGLIVLIAVISFVGLLPLVTPDINGVILLVGIFFQGLMANQAVYKLSVPPTDVVRAKLSRKVRVPGFIPS